MLTEIQRERIITVFLPALLSGEFEQGQKALRLVNERNSLGYPQTVKHCCLGVGTEMAIRQQPDLGYWDLNTVTSDNGAGECFSFRHADVYSDYMLMPEPVREWYGFTDPGGFSFYGKDLDSALADLHFTRKLELWEEQDYTLASMNDEGKSFLDIYHVVRAWVAYQDGLREAQPVADGRGWVW